jgi:peptidoglycan hydrolase CwlO-like protein
VPIRPEDEIAALEESKKDLQEELRGIEARIEELQKPPKKESA